MLRDYLPRSRAFYIALSVVSSGVGYVYWDRHQARLIQSLYEREASTLGLQSLKDNQQLPKVTVILSGRDNFECTERKKLFKRHVARLFLKAGMDWQVVEVNEMALGKRLNRVHLDDAERQDIEFFDRREYLRALACKWLLPEYKGGDQDIVSLLDSHTPVANPKDGFIALDSTSNEALEDGFKGGMELHEQDKLANNETKGISSWIMALFKKDVRPQFTHPALTLINIPLHTLFLTRLYHSVNTRQTTLSICSQAISYIKSKEQ